MSTQSLSVMDTRYGFTPEQVDVIKATIAPGATNEELALFLMVCQKTGLDPFSRQIYLSERRTKDRVTGQWTVKKTPETTIDGFRVIAERSNEYEGQVGPLWCGPDGVWQDIWLALDSMPSAAKVGVWRKGFREPVWGKALFEEYKQTTSDGKLNSMWQKMGANQLAKCAEALALRKAFPRDLSGLYAREEMGQADNNAKEAQQDVAQRRIAELKAEGEAQARRMAELKAAKAQEDFKHPSPETIIELANSLDHTPEPPLMAPDVKKPPKSSAYEMREAAKRDEAEQALKGDGVPKETRKRGAISFAALKQWGEIKKEILALTGTTDLYYEALKAGGYSHADEIKTLDDAAKIWKALKAITAELTPKKQDAALLLELETHTQRIGQNAMDYALQAHGLKSIKDMLALDGEPFQAFMQEIREIVLDEG